MTAGSQGRFSRSLNRDPPGTVLAGLSAQADNGHLRGDAGVDPAALVVLVGLQAELQEKREIAVDVKVKAPEARSVDVSIGVKSGNGADFGEVKANVEQCVTSFFTGRLLGCPVRLAELGSKIYGLKGVENYRFSAPAEDIVGSDTVLPVLGSLIVTEMEA
jgi:uncharacterized phage protein gp47/JayE